METSEADGRYRNKVTDTEGRRSGGGAEGGRITSNDDPGNIQLELEKRAIKQLVRAVNQLVKSNDGDRSVFFAAIKEINNQIMERLDPEVRTRIEKDVPEDLTKIKGAQLLSHFA